MLEELSSVSYATATAAGPVGSSVASDGFISVTSGHGGTFGSGSFNPRSPVLIVGYGDPTASPYTIAWSSGDSNVTYVDSLAFGPISATVTDCNGCQTSASGFVGVSVYPGCTDPTAWNYDPAANVDDSSCVAFAYACLDSAAVNYSPFDT